MLMSKIRANIDSILPTVKPPVISSCDKQIPKPVTISAKMPDASSIPEDKIHLYDQLKEIRPLQASIHAEMSVENNPQKRKVCVDQLLLLEQKRKVLWSEIDGSAETPAPELEENPVERGARLAKRQKQLKQNLKRGKCSEKKRLEYETELEAIIKELNQYGTK